LLFFYHFSDVTSVHTMQGLVFNCSEVRPKVVLAARWRRKVNLKSLTDSPTTVSYQCSFDIYRLPHSVSDFYSCNLRPEAVIAARWCRRQFLMSPIDSAVTVFYSWSVDVFRLGCTVKKICDIFGCALKFGFETNFSKFDLCSDPIC
jgi:hypothetical protein